MAKKRKKKEEPPRWVEAKRAVVSERYKNGAPKRYRDPVTNKTWSAYHVRLARNGYMTPRQVTAARKAIGADTYDNLTKTAEEGGIAPLAFIDHATMAANYARKRGLKNASEALASEGYWHAVETVLLPLQVSKRIGMAARHWSVQSAFDHIDEAWDDPHFYEYIMARNKKGERLRFQDIPEWAIADVFDNYDALMVEYFDAFGDTLQDWFY